MPTKTEQADLNMALFGRHGEAPVAVIAPKSPADCFYAALDAARIALTYRTPVILLSDGYIANGSEPWLLPEVADLPDLRVANATELNSEDGNSFLPYLRDPKTLARPWAIPGTPGLEHRIGGLEKADRTGDISYDPANHDFMVRTRAARIEAIEVPDVEVEDPDGDARVLVLGWGSTYGPIGAAARALRHRGQAIAQAHLRHLSPMPRNLGDVLARYEKVVIPEMNLGQLAHVIRGRYLVDAIGYNQVRGLPFTSTELETMLEEVVKNV
jgi:2-oxoglutarate ferredoxin oxidoreductase subunit alpha